MLSIFGGRKSDGDLDAAKALPGPWGVPLLGYLPWLSQERVFDSFGHLRNKYGDLYQIKMGSWPVVVINGEKTLKECLVKHSEAFAGRPDFFTFKGYCDGSSLAFQDYNPQWRLHHELAGQALSEMIREKEASIESLMNTAVLKAVNDIGKRQTKVYDPQELLKALAFDMACVMCFGEKSTTYEDPLTKQIIDALLDIFHSRKALQGVDIMPWTGILMGTKMAEFSAKQKKFEDLMAEKIVQVETECNGDEAMCAIRALRAVGERNEEAMEKVGLTMYRLLQSVQDFIGAGADTVGHLPRWVLLYMVHFPDVQRKVQEELDSVLAGGRGFGRMATSEDLARLPYTQAVILEVARHAAVVPLSIPRKVTKDVTINGFLVKKDSLAFANYHSAAHDKELWEDPEHFRPERFIGVDGQLDQETAKQWPLFGYGQRRCPGERLGRNKTFLIVTALLRRFWVREAATCPVPGLGEGFADISMEPGPFKIIFDDRLRRDSKSG